MQHDISPENILSEIIKKAVRFDDLVRALNAQLHRRGVGIIYINMPATEWGISVGAEKIIKVSTVTAALTVAFEQYNQRQEERQTESPISFGDAPRQD